MDTTVILIAVIALVVIGVPALILGRFSYNSRRKLARSRTDQEAPVTTKTRAPSLGDRLASTRLALGGRLASLARRGDLDERFWSEFQEVLIAADVGVPFASAVIDRVKALRPEDAAAVTEAVRRELVGAFGSADRHLTPLRADPITIVVVGVNGSGKTTTIAKLAQKYQELGAQPILGAADTFRAGAAEQLRVWAEGLGVSVVSGAADSDPAAVAHDTITAARARGADLAIIDTAGRLHSDTNLMEELAKVVRVIEREAGGVDEVLLVLDGTGGHNSIAQAKTFSEAVGVTGIIITKLDGTAKGGMAVAVESELGVPIKLIGVGESAEDLIPFIPEQFVNALLEVPDE